MFDDDYFPATQQLCPSTQRLTVSDDEEDGAVLLGYLHIDGNKHQVFSPQCKIGRDTQCDIILPKHFISISSIHAIIEGDDEGVTIHDVGSTNGTRKQNIKLKKNIRYNLEDGETLKFGNVVATFKSETNLQDETHETESNASNASMSLLDDDGDEDTALQTSDDHKTIEKSDAQSVSFENDENQSPNFVPETPANVGRMPRLGSESMFIPASQSSPLLTKNSHLFKVPESPNNSTLNDSSFLASSQPVNTNTVTSRLHLTKKTDTTRDTEVLSDETVSVTDTFVNESKASVTKGVRFDMESNGSLNLQLNSSELMCADTQAVCSESQIMCADTQAVTGSDSSLMMAATQAVDKFSESSIMSADTQQVAVMSESALMMASTQAVVMKPDLSTMSESSIMAAETQQLSVMSESALMMASTQAVAKFSDSPLLTQNISTDSCIMNAETQPLTFGKQSESCLMDQDTQDVCDDDSTAVSSPDLLDESNDIDNIQEHDKKSATADKKEEQSMAEEDAETKKKTDESAGVDNEDIEEFESDDEDFIMCTPDQTQTSRSKLVSVSSMSIVPATQEEDEGKELKNPVSVDDLGEGLDNNDDSEDDKIDASQNLLDDFSDNELTDEDLESLFSKQSNSIIASQLKNNHNSSQERVSPSKSNQDPSQERPSSEIIPASQEQDKVERKLSRPGLATNYSVQSMEQTNLYSQSSQDDFENDQVRDNINQLIQNLEDDTTTKTEECKMDLERTSLIKDFKEKENEVEEKSDDAQTADLDYNKTSTMDVMITPHKKALIQEEDVDDLSPILVRSQASHHSRQTKVCSDDQNDSPLISRHGKAGSSASSLFDNIPGMESDDDDELTAMPDLHQKTDKLESETNVAKESSDDHAEKAKDDVEVDPTSNEDRDEMKSANENIINDKTPIPEHKKMNEVKKLKMTPVQRRLITDDQMTDSQSPLRPESGPILPETPELITPEKTSSLDGSSQNKSIDDVKKKILDHEAEDVKDGSTENDMHEEQLGRGRRSRKPNSKYETNETQPSTEKSNRRSLPTKSEKSNITSKDKRKSVPTKSLKVNLKRLSSDEAGTKEKDNFEGQNIEESNRKPAKAKRNKTRASLVIEDEQSKKAEDEDAKSDQPRETSEENERIDQSKETSNETEKIEDASAPNCSGDPEVLFPGDEGEFNLGEALTQIQPKPSNVSQKSSKSGKQKSLSIVIEEDITVETEAPKGRNSRSGRGKSEQVLKDDNKIESKNVSKKLSGRGVQGTQSKVVEVDEPTVQDDNENSQSKDTEAESIDVDTNTSSQTVRKSRRGQSKEAAKSSKGQNNEAVKEDVTKVIDKRRQSKELWITRKEIETPNQEASSKTNEVKEERKTRGRAKVKDEVKEEKIANSQAKRGRGKNPVEVKVEVKEEKDTEENKVKVITEKIKSEKKDEKHTSSRPRRGQSKEESNNDTEVSQNMIKSEKDDEAISSSRTRKGKSKEDTNIGQDQDKIKTEKSNGKEPQNSSRARRGRSKEESNIDTNETPKQATSTTSNRSKQKDSYETVNVEKSLNGKTSNGGRKRGMNENENMSELKRRRTGSNDSNQGSGSPVRSARCSSMKTESKTTKRKNTSTDKKPLLKIKKESNSGSESPTRVDSQNDTTCSPSLRRAGQRQHRVLFTGYEDEKEAKTIQDLGGEVVTDTEDCSVLVTDKMRRTEKFLCMVGRGVPIVSSSWIQQSKLQGRFADPWSYILEDKENERKWGMGLGTTLGLVKLRGPLLHGLSFHVTKKVVPTPQQFKEIIESAGGCYLTSAPKLPDSQTFIISSPQDRAANDKFRKTGFNVMDKEFVLSGLLKYKMDSSQHL